MGRVLVILISAFCVLQSSASFAGKSCGEGLAVKLTLLTHTKVSGYPVTWSCDIGESVSGAQSMTDAEIAALGLSAFSHCFTASGTEVFNPGQPSEWSRSWYTKGAPTGSSSGITQDYYTRDEGSSSERKQGLAKLSFGASCDVPQCQTGYHLVGGQCVSDCADKVGHSGYFSNTTVASGCNADANCAVVFDSDGPKLAGSFDTTGIPVYFTGHYTGETCSEPDPQYVEHDGQPLPDGKTGACDGASSATSACITAERPNCGYVNGEYRCVTASQLTDENPCVTTASGGMFCKADAPNQPDAPTNPDGTKKTPDAQFKLTPPGGTSQTTVNYYSNSTVQGGANNPGSDEAGDEAGKGDCGSKKTPCHVVVDTGGTADGDGTGGGGGGDGDQDTPGGSFAPPSLDGVSDFGDSLTAFNAAVSAAPIVTAVAGLAGSIPTGGTLPSASFSAFGQQYTYSVPPEVVSAVASVLGVVMYAFWSLVAVRTFMSA